MSEQNPEPEAVAKPPALDSNVITFAEVVRQHRARGALHGVEA